MTPDGRASLRDVFAVARDPNLSAAEVRLWTLIRSYEQPDGRGAYPGDEKLAAHMDCSERSVQRHRASLLEKGYLRREFRGSRPSYYWADLPDHSDASTDGTKEDCDAKSGVATEDSDASDDGASESDASADGAMDVATPIATPTMSPEYGEYKNTYTGDGEEQQDLDLRDAVEVVWSHYVERYAERFSERGATLLKIETENRAGHIRQRLRDGFTPEELCRAIDGCFDDPWHRDKGKHDLEYILRNESKALDFLNRAEENGGPPDERPDGREELAAMEEAHDV